MADARGEFVGFPAENEYIALCHVSGCIIGHHSINNTMSLYPRFPTSLLGYGMQDYQMSVESLSCGRCSRKMCGLSRWKCVYRIVPCVCLQKSAIIPSITGLHCSLDCTHPCEGMEGKTTKCLLNCKAVAHAREEFVGFPANNEYIALCHVSCCIIGHHSINNRISSFLRLHTS